MTEMSSEESEAAASPPSDEWWPRPKGRKPPRQTIDRAKAVDTAVALIERHGPEAFSMRKLAAELGVGAPALYWHVTSRDQLLSMVVERALDGFELPGPEGPWQDRLVEMAHRWWHHWVERPRLAEVLGAGASPVPTIIRNGEWVAGLLDEAGLTRRDAAAALASWNAFLIGTTNQVVPLANRDDASPDPQAEPYIQTILQLDPQAFPNLRAVGVEYAKVTTIEDLFDVGLRGLVTGFEALASAACPTHETDR